MRNFLAVLCYLFLTLTVAAYKLGGSRMKPLRILPVILKPDPLGP